MLAREVIAAGKRDPTLDHKLELIWLDLRIQGTRYMPASMPYERISTLNSVSTSANIAGFQIAELTVCPYWPVYTGEVDV
jgi:hypothetical protein